ncbi:HAD family hydrolase [Gallibacterium anatis]|uniref:HAD family hydrolase n=1 Tax=Gallibacterium anatis TaxID=750 RepID=UPI000B2BE09C|nr:HAD family phosphatase [Gallibacterium anatis]
MMIDTLIFDMGNVLIEWDPDKFLHFIETDPDRIRALHQAIFASGIWAKQDNGEFNAAQAYQSSLSLLNSSYADSLSTFYFHWFRYAQRYLTLQQIAIELKNIGYKLYILSNTSAVFDDLVSADLLPITDVIDGKVLSYQVKLVKPDYAIYQHLLDSYQLNAANCLFLDDVNENLEAAQHCGIHTLKVTNQQQAIADLLSILERKGKYRIDSLLTLNKGKNDD